MKVGFTGTQDGMTEWQLSCVIDCLSRPSVTEIHHGDCIGADFQAHGIAQTMGIPIVVHPPDIDDKRAFCQSSMVLPPLPYLKRNRAIVNAVDLLIATPSTLHEIRRSGTWATVRYARKQGVPVKVFGPEEV